MPGQVDSSTVELLTTAGPQGHLQGAVVEVMWIDVPGEHKNAQTDFGTIHGSTVELLTTGQTVGHTVGAVVELMYLAPGGFIQEGQLDGSTVELMWVDVPGEHKNAQTDFGTIHGTTVELLTTGQTVGHVVGSVVELLTTLEGSVAAVVDNIAGPPLVPISFDGSGSTGSILQYQWAWTSVPGGSALANSAEPFPNFGGTTPIDMTSNVLLYHAEEVAGVSGFDTSGSGNTAALTNITVGVVGNVGSYAWSYLGSTSHANCTTPVSLAAGSYTISLWFFNLAPNTAWRTATRGTATDHQIIVETGSDRLGAFISGAFRPVNPQFDMPVGSYIGWHHIAVVGSGTESRFYVDGAFVGSVPYKSVENVDSIGNYYANNQRFADRLDEVAIWTRALSPTEIADIYILQQGSFTGVGVTHQFTPDVVGIYTIDLTVVSILDLTTSMDAADANIGLGVPGPYFLQGDRLRHWQHLQGNLFKRKKG